MGVIRPPRQAVLPSSGRSSDTSGAATPATQPNTDTESVASSGAATPRLIAATAAHTGVCPVQVRQKYLSVAKIFLTQSGAAQPRHTQLPHEAGAQNQAKVMLLLVNVTDDI